MRAVIYARVSSDDQVEGSSLDTQTQACREYCERKGYSILAEFREDYTGASFDRPELNKVIELAEKQAFEVLIVFSVDRFARDLAAHMVLRKEFEDMGISVEYTVGQFDDSPEGKLMEQIQAVISEYERAQITRRTEKGRRSRIEKGNIHPGRTAPYGYRYDEGEYIVVPDEAEIVQQIFDWYVNEKIGTVKIARLLTEMKVPTKWDIAGHTKRKRKRGVWYHTAVLSILKHRVYIGEYSYGKKTDNPIQLEIEAIIDTDTFEKAQQQRKINYEHAKRNTKYEYLLRRRLRCAVCGYKMNATTRNTSRSYYCNGSKKYHAADGETVSCQGGLDVADADKVVWSFIRKELTDVERLKARIEANRRMKEKAQEAARHNKEKLELRLVELDEEQSILLAQIKNRKISQAVFDAEVDKTYRERLQVEKQLAELDYRPVDISPVKIAGDYWLDLQRSDFTGRRKMLAKLDVQVLYHRPDKLEVFYSVQGERLSELLTV